MAQIDECQANILDAFDLLERDITKSPYELTQRDKWIKDCKKKLDMVNTDIQQYQCLMNQLPMGSSTAKYIGTFKSFNSRYDKLKKIFQDKLNKDGPKNSFSEKPKQKALDEMNAQELVERGDKTQEEMFKMLDDMDMTLEQGLALADQINLELDRQIEQLDRMTSKVDDTSTALRRAEKQLGYFKKVVQCDKWLLALLFLNLVALITLIILAIKKG